MSIHTYKPIVSKFIKQLICAFVPFLLCSCASGTGLTRYDGKRYAPTKTCHVEIFHSAFWLEKYADELSDDYELIGSSSFTIHNNSTQYTEKEMRSDCKKVGGDIILVLDDGIVDREKRTYTSRTEKSQSVNTTYQNESYQTLGRSSTTYNVPEYDTYEIVHSWTGYHIYILKDFGD